MTIVLTPPEQIRVLVPSGIDLEKVEAFVQAKSSWIRKHLEHWRNLPPPPPPPGYVNGEEHLFLGERYPLRIVPGSRDLAEIRNGKLWVVTQGFPFPEKVARVLDRWYREQAERVFREVFEQQFGPFSSMELPRPEIKVRHMKRRWGTMHRTRLMLLNQDLVKAPRSCVEYIVVHELCHMVHPHHQAPFHRLVAQVMPDWQERKRRLDQFMFQ